MPQRFRGELSRMAKRLAAKGEVIQQWNIVSGDKVAVLAGKEKGKQGVVSKVVRRENRLFIKGLNFHKKAVKMRDQENPGGILEREAPVHYSNVQLLDPATVTSEWPAQPGVPTRFHIGWDSSGRKVRVAKKSGLVIEKPVHEPRIKAYTGEPPRRALPPSCPPLRCRSRSCDPDLPSLGSLRRGQEGHAPERRKGAHQGRAAIFAELRRVASAIKNVEVSSSAAASERASCFKACELFIVVGAAHEGRACPALLDRQPLLASSTVSSSSLYSDTNLWKPEIRECAATVGSTTSFSSARFDSPSAVMASQSPATATLSPPPPAALAPALDPLDDREDGGPSRSSHSSRTLAIAAPLTAPSSASRRAYTRSQSLYSCCAAAAAGPEPSTAPRPSSTAEPSSDSRCARERFFRAAPPACISAATRLAGVEVAVAARAAVAAAACTVARSVVVAVAF